MTPPPIIYDVTRLVTRLGRATPNGIDRVDLEFARHFLGRERFRGGEALSSGALMGPSGIPHLLPRQTALAATEAIATCWQENGGAGGAGAHTLRKRLWASLRRFASDGKLAGRNGLWPGRGIVQHAPRNSVYLNVSQFPIWQPRYLSWLDARPDIRAVFFLHDMLPLKYPEFFRAFEVRRHLGRVEAMMARAAGIIVSGESTRAALQDYMTARGRPVPKVHVVPLASTPAFHNSDEGVSVTNALTGGRAYFVCIGTIEPRKNHLLLLNIWRELRARMGPQTPCLLLVGAKGWESENVDDMLTRCDALQGTVFRLSGIPTSELVLILKGARALLMPTFAEGFGLPVTESLAAGTPVVASDIDVFRPIRSPNLRLLDPLDGLGWLNAITALAVEKSCVYHRQPVDKPMLRAPACPPRDIEAFLSELD